MANVLGELFGNIANAIREKNGEPGAMKPLDFPAKIAAIEAAGGSSSSDGVYWKPLDIKRPTTGQQCWLEFRGKIYAFVGGMPSVYQLNDDGVSWTQIVSNGPTSWSSATVLCFVEHEGQIHIFGGSMKLHYVFDGSTLTKSVDVPAAVQQYGAFVQDGVLKVYCHSNKTVYKWDGAAWTAEATIAIYSTGAFFNTSSGVILYDAQMVYTYDGTGITELANIGMFKRLSVTDGEKIYGLTDDELWRFDPATLTYEKVCVAPGIRLNHSVFTNIGGKLCLQIGDDNTRHGVFELHGI